MVARERRLEAYIYGGGASRRIDVADQQPGGGGAGREGQKNDFNDPMVGQAGVMAAVNGRLANVSYPGRSTAIKR